MILSKRKIIFLTGTRADFGKIKSLLQILQHSEDFEPYIFVTGMHMLQKYGYTLIEVENSGFKNIETFQNFTDETTMDLTLAKTIEGFSSYIKKVKPDMIVVHGDRVEALAGAIVGSLNNILVSHIEGGEISGTIDELIRHSVSKMSHLHFVSNKEAAKRLLQMGEVPESIFTIGSPDIDIMFSDKLPSLKDVKSYYEIKFENYGIAMFHPVTTEIEYIELYARDFVKALVKSDKKFVVIYPNNDLGSSKIIKCYDEISSNSNFRILPSLRFEYFLTLLKNANFIIGNSSAGIREAPYYGVPTINIGTRQANRAVHSHIIHTDYEYDSIIRTISFNFENIAIDHKSFGAGDSATHFLNNLSSQKIWDINHQKQFREYEFSKKS